MDTLWCIDNPTTFRPLIRSSWLLSCPYAILLLVFFCSTTLPSTTPSSFRTVRAVAAASQTDRLSLLAFRDGIIGGAGGGPAAGALSSWNNDSLHHCRWWGVACSRRHAGRVTALNLTSLGLTGYVSPSIANLTFLQMLSLGDNQLRGTIPPQLGALRRLKYLDLNQNMLSGVIPPNLSRCSELQVINLARNQLVGEIPAVLGGLPRLLYLSIRSNQITGAIPSSLGNLSSDAFQVLWLSENKLSGSIPSELGRLRNLQFLGALMNGLSGAVPPSIYNLSNLYTLSFYQNQLSGTLPPDLGTTLPNLTVLNVGGNLFEGQIPSSLSNASSLQRITVESNNLRGRVPDNLGMLKDLTTFAAAYNSLEATQHRDWHFLTSLTNCTQLRFLSLASNELRGELPTSITNLSAELQHLFICENQISGSIPTGIANLRSLMRICMGENRFQGSIPPALGKLGSLEGLALPNNQLSGEIPSELGNLTLLYNLRLGNNNLSGGIPTSLGRCQHLRYLIASDNSLSGRIPDELSTLFTLGALDLSNNFLEGSLPSDIGRMINLQGLDLSGNRLSGYLPSSLGSCQSMEQLNLYGNSFEGAIPSSLRDLRGIQMLDLSCNNFTGKIPDFLGGLEYLRYLNLSFNNFTGAVPQNGIFANATAVSLVGNKMICGGFSALKLPRCKSQFEEKRNSSHSFKAIVPAATVGVCLILFFCFITYGLWMRKSRGKSPVPSSSEIGHKNISYHDLVKATDGFSQNNLIGRGSFGSVYKGIVDDEETVAVKVLNVQQRRGACKSFKNECEALSNIRHRNLVKIVSVCSSIDSSGNDFKALVFEFFPNGSLEKWLHLDLEVEERILDFAQRLSIAVDVAYALHYLHNHCHSPIAHCDLKPSNVLLDCNMTAHVGDFGLAKFILQTSSANLESDQSSTIGIKGSIGYVPPEYGLGNPVSTDGDVYSFGILLLELFTGNRPTDDMFRDGLSLQKYVEAALSEQAMSIIDPLLLHHNELESLQNVPNINSDRSRAIMSKCFVSLMRIGLNCTKETPRERMAMGAAVKEIQVIQRAYLV